MAVLEVEYDYLNTFKPLYGTEYGHLIHKKFSFKFFNLFSVSFHHTVFFISTLLYVLHLQIQIRLHNNVQCIHLKMRNLKRNFHSLFK